MRAAVKEVEDLEKKAREAAGLPTVAEEGQELPPIQLPMYKEMKRLERETKRLEMDKERAELEQSVEELETNMKEIQDRLKELSRDIVPEEQKENVVVPVRNGGSPAKKRPRHAEEPATPAQEEPQEDENSALGPEGDIVPFPEYDGSEPPKEAKKAFTQFCISTRKEVKQSLNPAERKDKEKVHALLRERWLDLPDEEKQSWRVWASWDKKRYARDLAVYEARQGGGKKRAKSPGRDDGTPQIPKKKKKKTA